jgi:hypothetical protein
VRRAALLVALLSLAAATGPASAAGGAPKLVKAEFYEDLEDGPRYNVDAAVKGDAGKVTARSGSFRTNGHLSGHISGPGKSRVWFFREHQFVKRVKADLYADGFATLVIKVSSDAGSVKKLCELNLEPDPQFGDYASGDCDKL